MNNLEAFAYAASAIFSTSSSLISATSCSIALHTTDLYADWMNSFPQHQQQHVLAIVLVCPFGDRFGPRTKSQFGRRPIW